MGNSDLRIDPVTPAIGAHITGIDLSQPVEGVAIDAIYQALIDHPSSGYAGKPKR
jgi:alpha-ketoglutarate-dependent taurine dioxygenase